MWSFLLLTVMTVQAQTRQITGKVTDQKDGGPLSGATITVKGTTISTITQADGSFSLSVPENATTLVISSVGYKQVETPVNSVVNVVMQVGDASLSEVVVVGYGTKIKRDLTGVVARVKGSEVANTPVPNFNQALQGRAAGVFVESNSGKVGEGVKVRIRGTGSLSASNDPLYVIDGIPVNNSASSGNPLSDINFNDIESFEILKDASSAAIYGARASNGVVLITTKRGKAGKTNLNVNMQYGVNDPTNYRGFLNAEQYVNLLREAAINSDNIEGVDPTDPAQYPGSWLQFAERRLTRYSGWSDWRKLETNTNWEKLAFNEKSNTTLIDLNLSGGNEKTKFYVSGGYNKQDGILFGNDFERISSRVNLEHDATNRLKIGFNLGLSRTVANRVADDNQFYTPMQIVALAPITPVYDLNGNLYDRPVTTYYNPLIELDGSKYISTTYRNLGSAFASYKLMEGLVFRTEFGLDLLTQNDDRFNGFKTIIGGPTNGYAQNDWFRTTNYNTNNYFNYRKMFGEKHDLDVTVGMSFQKYRTDFTSVFGEDFPVEDLQRLASAGRITGGTNTVTESSFLSYFARANYKFNDKYLLTVSGRYDGSSRFGKNNQYGFFPAVSVGWILSEESFLANSNTISFLKLRASVGNAGNADGFGNFAALGLYGASKYNNQSSLVPIQLPNPELGWEKSRQFDIGLDFGFLNNRISGEIDYYDRLTNDLIYAVPVPGTSGFTTQVTNVGAMSNKGIEFVLNTTNISKKNFTWNTSFNISRNKNQITRLDGDQTIIPGNDGRYLNSLIVGQPIGVFYGPKFAGADPNNGDALYYLEDGKSTTNDYNAAADFVVGDPNPDVIAGLNNTINFKGIELNFLFQGVFGNQVLNGAGGFMSASFDWFDNQTLDQLNRWQKPGDQTMVPQLRLGYGNGIGASSRYVQDADYIRLKNITLAYNLPGNVVSKLKMRSARFYVTAVNLATFTSYDGWDPEVNTDYRAGNRNQGSDFYAAPQIKSITVGLNLGF
nr:TonB-dependent receptor [Flavihumibacter rivuli]